VLTAAYHHISNTNNPASTPYVHVYDRLYHLKSKDIMHELVLIDALKEASAVSYDLAYSLIAPLMLFLRSLLHGHSTHHIELQRESYTQKIKTEKVFTWHKKTPRDKPADRMHSFRV